MVLKVSTGIFLDAISVKYIFFTVYLWPASQRSTEKKRSAILLSGILRVGAIEYLAKSLRVSKNGKLCQFQRKYAALKLQQIFLTQFKLEYFEEHPQLFNAQIPIDKHILLIYNISHID